MCLCVRAVEDILFLNRERACVCAIDVIVTDVTGGLASLFFHLVLLSYVHLDFVHQKFHRNVFVWMDKWHGLEETELERLLAKTIETLSSSRQTSGLRGFAME